MNRRDIIIIAVLINAGLLVVLFTSALKSDNAEPAIATQSEAIVPSPVQNPATPPSPVRGDEVDQVLSQFAAAPPASQEGVALATPLVQPVAVAQATPAIGEPPASPSGFLEEAQGFNNASPLSLTTPAAPVQPEVSSPAFKEVRVKKGDALEKIARVNNTTVQEIMRCNKLSSTQLKIGQKLKIPSKGAKQKALAKKNSEETRVYVVKNGDNPWTIAVKNQMKLEELLELNGLNEEKARKLKPGDQLHIR